MKKSLLSSIEQTIGRLFRGTFFTGVLATIFACGLPLLLGCRCPEADHPRVIADDPGQAKIMKTTLDKAQAKKTWTPADELAFRKSLALLTPETRLASALRLSALINSRAVLFDRSPSTSPPPPICPCTPGPCDRVATPPPAAPSPAVNVPPTSAPPVTKVK